MSKQKKASMWIWVLFVSLFSFLLTFSFGLAPGAVAGNGALAVAVLLLFIALGIVFDMLGLAAATVSEKPFRAMSARRVIGAEHALWLIVRADKVTSFCCDVVGDISGIISGAACPVIALAIWPDSVLTAVFLSAASAAMMVGGKALGKRAAIKGNTQIILFAGRVIWFFSRIKRNRKER